MVEAPISSYPQIRRRAGGSSVISVKEFFRAHEMALGFLPDDEKRAAIEAPADSMLYLVAGPGTGKTACLAVRVLKLMLVDDVAPGSIVATTFTRRAAAELRSRILSWGFEICHSISENDRIAKRARIAVENLDVNQLITGTIDSLCEDLLTRYRDPGTQPPVTIDEFVSRTLLLRRGLFEDGRYRSRRLGSLLLRLGGRTSTFGWLVGFSHPPRLPAETLRENWDIPSGRPACKRTGNTTAGNGPASLSC
jgi:DNA helicase-2/ATP-dependent DNA helicase PcrA